HPATTLPHYGSTGTSAERAQGQGRAFTSEREPWESEPEGSYVSCLCHQPLCPQAARDSGRTRASKFQTKGSTSRQKVIPAKGRNARAGRFVRWRGSASTALFGYDEKAHEWGV